MFVAILTAAGMLLVMFITMGFYASRYKKVGPNQALIISGRSRFVHDPQTGKQELVGYRIVTGGGTFIWPIIERVDVLSLEAIPFGFTVEGQFRDGAGAQVQGEAQVAVGQDTAAIHRAANRLLSKSPTEIADLARQTLSSEVRAALMLNTADEMRDSLVFVAEQITQAWQSSLAELGLACLTLDIASLH